MPNVNTNTTATNAEFLRTYYNRTLLSRLLPQLVFAMFAQPKPMPQKEGQSVNFRGFDPLAPALTPLTEGVTPDGNTLSMFNFSATPVQIGDWLGISDVVDLTVPDPVLTETMELFGEQAAETVDILVRNVLMAGTNVQRAGGVATRAEVATKITADEIAIAVRTMHTNKIKKISSMINASTGIGTSPIAAAYVGIVDASTLYDLKKISGWTPVEQYASVGDRLPFEVGALDEVRFVMTHNPKVYDGEGAGSPAADVHATLILGRDAYGIVQLHGIESVVKGYGAGDDPLNQRMTAGWKGFFTTVILQQLALIRIEHLVS